MRKLLTFGPGFGLPDPSPFCLKAMVLLKMAGLEFAVEGGDPRTTPKKKVPVLVEDNGEAVPDTTFIRLHLEKTYGVDFDAELLPAERGVAWAFEKLAESELYFAMVHERWMVEENFNAGPRAFFNAVPMPLRAVVIALVKRQVRRDLFGHGMGRHSRDEIVTLGKRGFDAISAQLGENPWLMGDTPCGADASVWSFVAQAAVDIFDSDLKRHVRATPNLMAYRDRGLAKWFPDYAS